MANGFLYRAVLFINARRAEALAAKQAIELNIAQSGNTTDLAVALSNAEQIIEEADYLRDLLPKGRVTSETVTEEC